MKTKLVEIEMGVLIEVESVDEVRVGQLVRGFTCAGWTRREAKGRVKKVF